MKKTKFLLALCLAGNLAHAQIITTVAGNGYIGGLGGGGYSGDNGAATSAELNNPTSITIDASGNIYIADVYNNRVRKVNTSGVITTIAGNGTGGFSGDNGAATSAELYSPRYIAIDASGNIYIADSYNNRIRKVTISTGIITTIAGTGTGGFSGDNGAATSAELYAPTALEFDASGNLYIADTDNSRVRKINTSGIITTVAGNGGYGNTGDNGPATSAELEAPSGLVFDGSGNLYISDNFNYNIRKVNTSGTITTIAGTGTAGYSGDNGPATLAQLNAPWGIAIDAVGNLYIADVDNYRVRRINTAGIISTVAGNGTQGYNGDNIAPTSAELNYPTGVAFDTQGNLYICDQGANRVRKVTFPACTANAGPNITDYDNGTETNTLCANMTIGTASVTGQAYAWAPNTALSCTNCAQPATSYDNFSTPILYTVTVNGTGCTTNTSTVQVTTHATPTLAVTLSNMVATTGHNITAVGTYTGNTTPNNYYWEIDQCDQFGTLISGGYTWNSWMNGAPVGTFTFANTSTLACNTYYRIVFAVQNTNACLGWVTTAGMVQITPANAGPNMVNTKACCGGWPGVTIGTSSVSGMTYSWAPSTKLSSTTVAQPTCTWTNTSTSQIYTLTVSGTSCATATSTVKVSAYAPASCCRLANPNEGFDALPVSNLSVFPNPGNGNVTISISNNAEYIRITDMQGRLVFETKDTNAGEFKLDISKFNKGIYFIIAQMGNVIEKQKLIVE